MNCYCCTEEVDPEDFVEIIAFTKEEGATLACFHPACYNRVVAYLKEKHAEWSAAVESAPRGKPRVSK